MTIKNREFQKGIRLRPSMDALVSEGDIQYNATDDKLKYQDSSTTREIVNTDEAQTLTNKTIDADSSTITNIDNADIKVGAAIDAAKIHDGSVSNTEFGYLDGVTSAIQTQLNATASATALNDHITDAVDAHDASAISNVPAGNLAATDVQAALNELQGDIDTNTTGLSNHLADAVDAHDASAISNIPSGNLAATDIQGAVNELQTDIDTRALNSALTSHTGASTGVHGVTGAVVGTTDTQDVSNKTFTNPVILEEQGSTPATPASGDMKLYAKTDSKLYFLDDTGFEQEVGSGSSLAASNQISNLGLLASVSANALTVALKDKDGSNPTSISAVKVGFRSPTLTSGNFNQRSIEAALSLVISSGSTLGHLSGSSHFIYIYLVDSGSGVVLGASSSLLDEGILHTSVAEGGAGASDDANVLYTSSAQTDKPIRLIGRLLSNQATAGTWATGPSQTSLVPFQLGGQSGSSVQVAILRDEKASGTGGGSNTGGDATDTRVLNTKYGDSFVTLSSDQFTLPAGKYLVHFQAPGFQINAHKALLYNVTDASSPASHIGSNEEANATHNVTSYSKGSVYLDLSVPKTYEIRHQTQTASATTGFGPRRSAFSKTEVYTEVVITKLGSDSSSGDGSQIAIISDQKTSGTDGGTFTSGSWQTHTLNTLEGDSSIVPSLSTNQFQLTAGVYEVDAMATAFRVTRHQIRLQNITDATTIALGSNAFSQNAGGTNDADSSQLYAKFTITSTKTFELQHRCSVTNSSQGFGSANSFGSNELYAQLKVVKLKSTNSPAVGLENPILMSNVVATRLGHKTYLHGVAYNSSIQPTVTGTSFTVVRARFVPYQMQDGAWRLRFNIHGTRTTGTSIGTYTLTINGVVFRNTSSDKQAVSFASSNLINDRDIGHAATNPNAATITFAFPTNDPASFTTSGDVELESKPTWAY